MGIAILSRVGRGGLSKEQAMWASEARMFQKDGIIDAKALC